MSALTAVLTVLAVPAGGALAMLILWAALKEKK
jgi:hypothetical protein